MDQNHVPYRLATPQLIITHSFSKAFSKGDLFIPSAIKPFSSLGKAASTCSAAALVFKASEDA